MERYQEAMMLIGLFYVIVGALATVSFLPSTFRPVLVSFPHWGNNFYFTLTMALLCFWLPLMIYMLVVMLKFERAERAHERARRKASV